MAEPVANRKLLATGLAGTAVAALCCFTPVLALALAAVGLSFAAGYADIVLLPALAGFAALTLYALIGRKHP